MPILEITLLLLFVAGYGLIILERPLRLNKSAIAILTAVLSWTVLMLPGPVRQRTLESLARHTGDISGILFFLIAAMTIVELIDLHGGFDAITSRITTRNKPGLLWIFTLISFFLSAVLDNLTTAIVMVSLVSRLLKAREDRLLFVGVVIIAVNAGGAWSPIGDVTTTMLWITDRISTWKIVVWMFLPSLACAAIPVLLLGGRVKGRLPDLPEPVREERRIRPAERVKRRLVFFTGIGALLMTPIFKSLTHLPPFMGVLLGLSVLWILTLLFHPSKGKSVASALRRIDFESILFFLGILLSVAALESSGILARAGAFLERTLGRLDLVAVAMGFISAVIDNVPLVAAMIGMYGLQAVPTDHPFWMLLSYCAGTGGSLLLIGSAAGVVAAGMAKIDFLWYLKKIGPYALAGYLAGIAVFALQTLVL